MQTKTRVTVTINTVLYEQLKDTLDRAGIKLSTFTEMMYRTFIDSETKPMIEIYDNVFAELKKSSKKLKPKK